MRTCATSAISNAIRRFRTAPGSSCPRNDAAPSCRAWITRTQLPRLGFVGRRRRVGTHIIHRVAGQRAQGCRQDATAGRTMEPCARHVRRHAKPPACKFTMNGELQPSECRKRDTLTEHDSHERAVQDRPAQNTNRASERYDCKTCASTRDASRRAKSRSLANGAACRRCSSQAGRQTHRGRERTSSVDWWLATTRRQNCSDCRRSTTRSNAKQADIRRRGTVGYVMQEKTRARRWRSSSIAASTIKREDQVHADDAGDAAAVPADLPRNRLGLAQWLLRPEQSAHGARHGESLLAGSVRHGPRAHGGRLRRRRANCRRIRNCSIGWRSSSANRAGM